MSTTKTLIYFGINGRRLAGAICRFAYAFALTAFIVLGAMTVRAATFTVTTTADAGPGSLREAITTANTNGQEDTISFDAAVFATPQTIVLSSGQLFINADSGHKLTILGPGADLLTLSGNNTSRIAETEYQTFLEIRGVKMSGGRAAFDPSGRCGGALMIQPNAAPDSFILRDSILTGNYAELCGGALYASAKGKIVNTAIYDNLTGSYGGAIFTSTELSIINSTISGNRSEILVGGVYSYAADITLVNSTIAYNVAGGNNSTGGIGQTSVLSDYPTLVMRNSIVANNLGYGGSLPGDVQGPVTSQGHNVIGAAHAAFITGDTTGNQLNVDPQLDPQLHITGGPVPTHGLSAGSPAIDSGNNCVLDLPIGSGCITPGITTDARGTARPQDGDSNGTAIVDIGAHEVTAAEIATAPAKPDLAAKDDTGASNSDNITKARDLSLSVGGLIPGATVEIYRGGTLLSSQTVAGTSISFEENGHAANTQITYAARQIIDGVPSAYSPALVVKIDNTAPTVTLNAAAGQADPANSLPINFTAVFSEVVTGFDGSEISLAGSSAGVSQAAVTVTGSGPSYNLAVSNITSDGTVTAALPADTVQDPAGNNTAASTSADNTVTLDVTRPAVTIQQAASQLDPSSVPPINFTVTFSEPVTGFGGNDISLSGSTANVQSATKYVSGSGTTYNVAISNIVSQSGVVTASVVAGAASDAAQNTSTASTSQDNSVTLDNVGPTVTINQSVGQTDPASSMPVNFTAVFSEPVTGFDAADLSFSGSSVSTTGAQIEIIGTGTTYSVAVAGLAANGGVLKVQVRPAAVIDSLGNPSVPSTSSDNTVVVDTVIPTVTVEQAVGQPDPALTGPIRFRVTFSETVTGFDASDVVLTDSTAYTAYARVDITGSGRVYDVAIQNITSSGIVRVRLAPGAARDLRGNDSLASTSNDNSVTMSVKATLFDFDGDGHSDVSVRRPGDNTWYIARSSVGFAGQQFGIAGDRMAPADYDGDAKTDVAVFRPSTGTWHIFRSSSSTIQTQIWGVNGDLPVPSDRDGDGTTDLVLYRPSNNTWYTRFANGTFGQTVFGESGDKPVVGDFDADGRGDVAVFRPSNNNWYIIMSSIGFFIQTWGQAGDVPITGDFDGDGATDRAVFRPSTGQWYLSQTTQGFSVRNWGQNEDVPAAADYDGDGRTDVAVFRPSNGTWYIVNSTAGILFRQFGVTGDIPTQTAFNY